MARNSSVRRAWRANGFQVGTTPANAVDVITSEGKLVADQAVVSVAVTAAADPGAAIPATATHVVVTSGNADHIVILPAPVPGKRLIIVNGATGYELRSSAPASIGINGGVGAGAESAIAASMVLELICVSATNWIGSSYTAAGVKGVVQVAA